MGDIPATIGDGLWNAFLIAYKLALNVLGAVLFAALMYLTVRPARTGKPLAGVAAQER